MGSQTFLEEIPAAPPVDEGDVTDQELDLTKETQTIEPSEVGSVTDVLEATEVAAATPKQGKPSDVVGNTASAPVYTEADGNGI